MYSSASPLLCRQGLASDPLAVLSSACGSRQGDVLGTACMAMPLQGPIEEVNQIFGVEGVSCTNISDNAIFMGPADAVGRAFDYYSEKCAAIGLKIRPDKSEAWSPTPSATAALEHLEPLLRDREIQGFPAHEGLIILGTPVGSDEYVKDKCKKAVESSRPLANAIQELGAFHGGTFVQHAFLLLHYCLAPRITHLLCGVLPALVMRSAKRFDLLLRTTFTAILGVPLDHLDDTTWSLASLRRPSPGGRATCNSSTRTPWPSCAPRRCSMRALREMEKRVELLQ
mmetsp:Transcript_37655/g.118715  ORF Transcript_37655/g.118715 Transcript_37655/m.118715 type:complete len:284 (-) Transcript_37655:73-924(-)